MLITFNSLKYDSLVLKIGHKFFMTDLYSYIVNTLVSYFVLYFVSSIKPCGLKTYKF